jgi:1,4-alpha-glucan branching enzyme
MDDPLAPLGPAPSLPRSSTPRRGHRHAERLHLRGDPADPFGWLGPHAEGDGRIVRALLPGARAVTARSAGLPWPLVPDGHGLFAGWLPGHDRYLLAIDWPDAREEVEDAYGFGPVLSEAELRRFAAGHHLALHELLGARPMQHEGVDGVVFAVWAPAARRVSVVGDFDAWDGRRHAMRLRHTAGVWELFVPRLRAGALYKYEIHTADGRVITKADPIARRTELPPATASIVAPPASHAFADGAWMRGRARRHAASAPLSIYEVHLASFQRPDGRTPTWDELAGSLVPYAADLRFTHLELMPVMEHPFGGSWGYQPLGLFAPTARHGDPEGFARFVDACHAAGLGVILDWVPGHFPRDEHGLARFDGTALYEHADPREGEHPDWGTLVYNFGRHEVASFLLSSALYWIERFHVDGLRVDAVASMLYRDYSRHEGAWLPNHLGGRENLEAIGLLRRLNEVIAERHPDVLVIAEESTAWAGVTARPDAGGLGFSHKWNMGWMNDTLRYFARDPVHRAHHHDDVTFGLLYAFSERFLLPLSHDEVVHGKGSLLGRMPGDRWRRFAQLRALFALAWGHPGKKLLFMGGELAQPDEWRHEHELPWHLLADPAHRGVQRLVRDLNALHASEPALHARDHDPYAFSWLVVDDADQSVFAWVRRGPEGAPPVLVAVHLTPVPRHGYRIGVPIGGRWWEVLNSDAAAYGGGDVGSGGVVRAEPVPSHGHPESLVLTLPPLGAVFLRAEHADAPTRCR